MTHIVTIYPASATREQRERTIFLGMAIVNALIVVSAFGSRIVLGITWFSDWPWWLHFHSVPMMGWIGLLVVQSWLVWRGDLSRHRKLGWIGALLATWMVAVGLPVTPMMSHWQVGQGHPFTPDRLVVLIANMINISMFGLLVLSAILMRRRTDWHRRLMVCATILLVVVAWFRLLNLTGLPAGAIIIVTQVLPLLHFGAFMAADRIINGRIHPAWFWGVGLFVLQVVSTGLVASSPAGTALAALVSP